MAQRNALKADEAPGWELADRPALSALGIKTMVALFLFIAVSTGPRYLPPAAAHWLERQTAHWLATSTTISTAPLAALTRSVRARWAGIRGGSPVPRSGAWPWLSTSPGRLTGTFGWQNPGPQAKFLGGIQIQIPPGQPVLSGPGGTVIQVRTTSGGVTVEERVSSAVTLVVGGLQSSAVGTGTALGPSERLGVSGKRPLLIQVLDQGYPVDPLDPKFFGRPKTLGR